MRGGGAGLGRRAVGDDRAAGDKAGPIARMGAPDRGGDRVVIHAVDPLGGPAMRAEPHDLIVRDGEIGRPVDRDRIVVPEDNQLVEPQMPGERQSLVADPLHQAAIAAEHIGAMLDEIVTELGRQVPLGERHADGVAEPLPKRPGRHLDAARQPAFGVPGRAAADLTEPLYLVYRHVRVAGQMQQSIKQHRAVPVRQDKAVAVGPIRRLRVKAQELREQDGRDIGHAHRHAGMAGFRLLDRVHRERSKRVRHAAQFRVGGRGQRSSGGIHDGTLVWWI